ncbi:DUF2318 domain-containing protein [Anaerocolumna sp.]|uniref:DUF2318 domain-containing protein n=1 Tax=Anaerocolumna sp. TaxID=2041569 RepID=UPI0028ACC3D5|nr:DUF2318 domain-containing protein [Anaerocolumna sp.]
MSNNKKTNQPKKKNTNPLLIAAIAVGVVAIAIVLLVPEKKTILPDNAPNSTNASNSSDTSNTSADTSDLADSTVVSSENAIPAVFNEDGDVVIQTADISETATFYTMDVEGTTMGLFALKASDGTIRTAFDTCQICNGSPYAFFTQQGDKFQCQNCGNIYSAEMIEQERGGCNPVPIMADEKTQTDTEITIPLKLIKDNAERFANWKKF